MRGHATQSALRVALRGRGTRIVGAGPRRRGRPTHHLPRHNRGGGQQGDLGSRSGRTARGGDRPRRDRAAAGADDSGAARRAARGRPRPARRTRRAGRPQPARQHFRTVGGDGQRRPRQQSRRPATTTSTSSSRWQPWSASRFCTVRVRRCTGPTSSAARSISSPGSATRSSASSASARTTSRAEPSQVRGRDSGARPSERCTPDFATIRRPTSTRRQRAGR